jgi:hypothetical protein
MRYRLILPLLLLFLAACTSTPPLVAARPTPMAFQPTLGRALSFLVRQYDTETKLLHPASTQTDIVWLAPDNQLVEWVLQEAHAAELSGELETSLDEFETPNHGLIETIKGAVVEWPPRARIQQEVAPSIWQATYSGGDEIENWAAFTNLAFFASLNSWNAGSAALAKTRFDEAMQAFDGTGFHDGEWDGRYTTADLALALLVGERIGEPVNDTIVRQLLALQGKDGGFAAHYTATGPADDADTETTAIALLALYALRQPTE